MGEMWPKKKRTKDKRTERETEGQVDVIDSVSDISPHDGA